MAASYPTSTKSFTTKIDGNTISAAHVNDAQDEIVAVETGLRDGLAHDLKFTDASYDIGKSGATRPRHGYFSGNLVAGGTLAITGATTLTGAAALNGGATVTGDIYTTAWVDYAGTSTVTGWTSFTSKKIFYKKIGKTVLVRFDIDGTSNATSVSFTLPVAQATDGFSLDMPLGLCLDNNAVVTTGILELPSASATVTCYTTQGGAAWTGSARKRVHGQFWYEAAS